MLYSFQFHKQMLAAFRIITVNSNGIRANDLATTFRLDSSHSSI